MSDLEDYFGDHDNNVKNLQKKEKGEVLLYEQHVTRQHQGGPKYAISAMKRQISVKFGCSKSTNPENWDSEVPICRNTEMPTLQRCGADSIKKCHIIKLG